MQRLIEPKNFIISEKIIWKLKTYVHQKAPLRGGKASHRMEVTNIIGYRMFATNIIYKKLLHDYIETPTNL